MKLPPYPQYKPSEIEWLGNLPEHWETRKLGRVTVSRCDGPFGSGLKSEHYTDEGVRVIRLQNIRFAQFEDRDRAFIEPEYYRELGDHDVLAGDLLVAGLGDENNPVGRACVAPPNLGLAMVKADCFRFRLNTQGANAAYLALQLSTTAYALAGAWATGTTRARMNLASTAERAIALPPLPEQHAIADFLDRETAKIDTLVAKKRTLIERLKEKRAALISRTVTRGLPPDAARAAGLDPHPRLKPSGIDWLGDVPEHWEVLEVRRAALRVKTGSTPPTSDERYYTDGTVPWFGPGSFDDEIALSKPVKSLHACAITEGAARLFKSGSSLVVTIGATLGKVSSLLQKGSCNQQITVIEFDTRCVHPRFGTYQLKRLEPVLRGVAPSATLPILDQNEIASISLALPPAHEQRAITDFLDCETAKTDQMVSKIEAAVELLQEYRTALITAAVTGKIDVRGAVA